MEQSFGSKRRRCSSDAIAVDHPGRHVVDRDIGGGGGAPLGQLLVDQDGVEIGELRAADVLPHVDAAEAEPRRLAQRLDRKDLVLVPFARKRHHLVAREGARGVLECALLVGEVEVHRFLPRPRPAEAVCGALKPAGQTLPCAGAVTQPRPIIHCNPVRISWLRRRSASTTERRRSRQRPNDPNRSILPKSRAPGLASGVLLSIQAMRGIAVLAVILVHIQLYFSAQLGMPDFIPYFNIGAASVDLFFVISGFIMVYASERLFGRPGAHAHLLPAPGRAHRPALLGDLDRSCSSASCSGTATSMRADGFLQWIVASYAFLPFPRGDGSRDADPWRRLDAELRDVLLHVVRHLRVAVASRRRHRHRLVVLHADRQSVSCSARCPSRSAFWTCPIIIEFVFGMIIALAYRDGVRLPRWRGSRAGADGPCGLRLVGDAGALLRSAAGVGDARRAVGRASHLRSSAACARASSGPPPNGFWRSFGFLGDASYSLYLVHPLALGLPRMVLSTLGRADRAHHGSTSSACSACADRAAAPRLSCSSKSRSTEALQKKIEARPRAPMREMAPGCRLTFLQYCGDPRTSNPKPRLGC